MNSFLLVFFMSELARFKKFLEEIDSLLDQYDPGELAPDRVIGEIVAYRAQQRPLLEQAIAVTNQGLKQFPFNPELLRRRAFANSRIVTPEGDFPCLEACETDFRTILAVDPYHLRAGLDLLEAMFKFSGLEDGEVAQVAGSLALQAESLLVALRSLEVRALGYAGNFQAAETTYQRWSQVFPDSEELQSAQADVESLTGNQEL
ncbi:MAG: hypothetical protein K1Y36_21130 [Blastocatellia bacterium]|nr:hypothetical protein [Blastocatellia bacterium]